jgi:hypothetical protein
MQTMEVNAYIAQPRLVSFTTNPSALGGLSDAGLTRWERWWLGAGGDERVQRRLMLV